MSILHKVREGRLAFDGYHKGGGGKGGGGGGSSTTVQKIEPWKGQEPYLKNVYEEAQNQYQNTSAWPDYYPGSQVAPFSPNQLAAQQGVLNVSQALQPSIQQGFDALSFALQAPNVAANPLTPGMIQNVVSPTVQTLTEQVLPNIRSGALEANQYGGSRQGIAEGIAMREGAQEISQNISELLGQMYSQGLDAQGRALALQPQILSNAVLPAQLTATVGDQQQAMQQALIQEAVNQWNYSQSLPSAMLNQYSNLIGGGTFGGGSATSTFSGGAGSGVINPIQGALGGYSLGSSLGPSGLGLAGSWAGPVGALLGLGLSLF